MTFPLNFSFEEEFRCQFTPVKKLFGNGIDRHNPEIKRHIVTTNAWNLRTASAHWLSLLSSLHFTHSDLQIQAGTDSTQNEFIHLCASHKHTTHMLCGNGLQSLLNRDKTYEITEISITVQTEKYTSHKRYIIYENNTGIKTQKIFETLLEWHSNTEPIRMCVLCNGFDSGALPQTVPKCNTFALAVQLTNFISELFSENIENTLLFVTETNTKLSHFMDFIPRLLQNMKLTTLTRLVWFEMNSFAWYVSVTSYVF